MAGADAVAVAGADAVAVAGAGAVGVTRGGRVAVRVVGPPPAPWLMPTSLTKSEACVPPALAPFLLKRASR